MLPGCFLTGNPARRCVVIPELSGMRSPVPRILAVYDSLDGSFSFQYTVDYAIPTQ